MSPLGQVHFLTALVALATGAFVVLRPKGSAQHRRTGWAYATSMIALNATALSIYTLTGSFGPFHLAALVSLATLAAGLLPARRRRGRHPMWLVQHYYFMSYSYLGLVAAAVAETATRWPAIQEVAGGPTVVFWITVAVASATVFIAGGIVVRRRAEVIMRPFQRRQGRVSSGLS